MAVPLMVAFMNIGLKEEAFQGSRSEQHCVNIRLQVQELRSQHNVTMYCFVEAGEPRVGLTDKSKKLFMQAVAAGASELGTPEISFIWELNESLVAAFPAKLGRHYGCPQLEKVTEGPLLTDLYHHQPWRNSMQLFLDGPTDTDKITIFLSHQPSSTKHKLSTAGRETIFRSLMKKGLISRVPKQPPRFLIGGDLNTKQALLNLTS